MNKLKIRAATTATAAVLAMAATAGAHGASLPGQGTWASALQPRDYNADGVVDAYYDTSRNLTWLADADPIGATDYYTGKAWVDSLTVHGTTGWRLPIIVGVAGGFPSCDGYYTYDGSSECGYNVPTAGSELAHMNQVLLGNKPYWDTSSNGGNTPPQPGWGLTNTGPFSNLVAGDYTTAHTVFSDFYIGEEFVWLYQFGLGYQDAGEVVLPTTHFWVVHDGDVTAVPEPGTWALLLAGLASVGHVVRRHRA